MRKIFIYALIAPLILLSGCDSMKDKLGLTRHAPDEFAVMQRAPLEIPSDLTKLPPPQLGAPRPQETPAVEQARQVILGTQPHTQSTQSSAESALLGKTGTGQADIRAQLVTDVEQGTKDNRPVVKKLLGIGDGQTPASVVDAEAEAKRIQDAKKAGQPVTTGETPVLKE